ncbi:hypothetical protein PsYK624_093440 [Phanerochaete sordida]|uniref:Uncharacterized protein n=1 Tax=Phanerochaete sordida TaxID=48140 RepID=A0A9P3GE77_9APHY|nr:hypothetical protein PsYK624_093440 [Phanerochaete sordida]
MLTVGRRPATIYARPCTGCRYNIEIPSTMQSTFTCALLAALLVVCSVRATPTPIDHLADRALEARAPVHTPIGHPEPCSVSHLC